MLMNQSKQKGNPFCLRTHNICKITDESHSSVCVFLNMNIILLNSLFIPREIRIQSISAEMSVSVFVRKGIV